MDLALLAELTRVANEVSDGHLTILKFTTNWRVGFGTPGPTDCLPDTLKELESGQHNSFFRSFHEGATFTLAAQAALDADWRRRSS